MIDINMGCPAKKVTQGASGSALMKTPDHALRLIEAVTAGEGSEGCFSLLDIGGDPYPGLFVGDVEEPHHLMWAIQLSQLEPLCCEALPDVTFFVDTVPDPAGAHRVYSQDDGARGDLEFATLADFMAFASNEAYLAGIGHRTAALEDSRLLPLVEFKDGV